MALIYSTQTCPLDNNRGQSHILGFAICLPLVLVSVFFIFCLSWLGWQNVSLDHALYQTSWTMDTTKLDKALTSSNTDEVVFDMIEDDWVMLDSATLSVSNAHIKEASTRENQELSTKQDHVNNRIERTTKTARFAHISADVTYTVKLPFALFHIKDVILTRHIDKTQQVTNRFEVS